MVLIQFSGRYVYDTCEKVIVDLFSRRNKLAICIFRCLFATELNKDQRGLTNSF